MSAQDTVETTEVTEQPAEQTPRDLSQEGGEVVAEATEAETEESQERDDKGRFKNKVQERIDELTRKAGEAQREAAYYRGLAEQKQPKETTQVEPQGEPKEEDFASTAEFIKASIKYGLDQARQAENQTRQQQAQAESWEERVAEARKTIPDIDSVISTSTAPMTEAMKAAIITSEQGPALAVHLAQNVAEAARIAKLPPMAAARELFKIESSLSQPAQKRVTSTPAPATPVGSGRSLAANLETMSYADFKKELAKAKG